MVDLDVMKTYWSHMGTSCSVVSVSFYEGQV